MYPYVSIDVLDLFLYPIPDVLDWVKVWAIRRPDDLFHGVFYMRVSIGRSIEEIMVLRESGWYASVYKEKFFMLRMIPNVPES